MPIDPRWLSGLSPWIQGFFGGAGATLLWEGVLKPRRARRRVAHALAEEIALALTYAASQRLYVKHLPKGVPGDFAMSDVVFNAVAAQLGELPELLGEIVIFYQGVRDLNHLPVGFAESLRAYRSAEVADQSIHQRELDSILGVYRSGLETCVDRANKLLPKLHKAAIPWYRFDRRLRKPRLLSLDQLAKDVDAVARLREKDLSPDRSK